MVSQKSGLDDFGGILEKVGLKKLETVTFKYS